MGLVVVVQNEIKGAPRLSLIGGGRGRNYEFLFRAWWQAHDGGLQRPTAMTRGLLGLVHAMRGGEIWRKEASPKRRASLPDRWRLVMKSPCCTARGPEVFRNEG